MSKTTACILCGEQRTPYQLSKHRNAMMNSKFGFCKECQKTVVDENDIDSVFELLRMMNIPFVSHVWETAVENDGQTFGNYLKLIATKKQYENFADSVYENDEHFNEKEEINFEVTNEIIARWGARENSEYLELEKAYENLVRIKEPTSFLDQRRYIQNVQISKALSDSLRDGSKASDISALRKAYTDDLKDLGLDVVSAQKDEKRSLGQRIAEWEREEPIPSLGKEFEDVDNITGYIRKWFLTPMKRVFGRATEEEISELYEEL